VRSGACIAMGIAERTEARNGQTKRQVTIQCALDTIVGSHRAGVRVLYERVLCPEPGRSLWDRAHERGPASHSHAHMGLAGDLDADACRRPDRDADAFCHFDTGSDEYAAHIHYAGGHSHQDGDARPVADHHATRSKYPYTAEVTYQPSPINPCGATYILGTITDLAGQPVTANNMVIRVEGDGDIETGNALHPGGQVRTNKPDGASPFAGMGFGPSAWNVVINLSGTSSGTWRVMLIQGGQVSDRIEVNLQSSCAQSSAVVRFQQNH
jgi:hypothetical protein